MRHLDTNIVIAYLNGNRTVATQLKAYQLIHQPTVETRNRTATAKFTPIELR